MTYTTTTRALLVEPVSDETAERIAYILGGSSGMAKALSEMKARRQAGEDVRIWRSGGKLLVGPDPAGVAASDG